MNSQLKGKHKHGGPQAKTSDCEGGKKRQIEYLNIYINESMSITEVRELLPKGANWVNV